MSIAVAWSEFKRHVNKRKVTINEVDDGVSYRLSILDGAFALRCNIPLDPNNPDTSDYIANFRSSANKSPISGVTTRLENADRSRKYLAIKTTATKNSTSSIWIKAPGSMSVNPNLTFNQNITNDRLIFSGQLQVKDGVLGDYIYFEATDKNNSLGQGADFTLKTYRENVNLVDVDSTNAYTKVGGIFIKPDGVTELSNSTPARLYGGMWLKISYVSTGAVTDPELFLNIIWDKQEI